MVRKSNPRSGTALTRACYLTAILNSLVVPAYAQDALPLTKSESTEPPLRYGPFDVLYTLGAGVAYDDNIFISRHKTSDFLWTISPSMAAGAGDYREMKENALKVEYRPSIILFTDKTENNALDHDLLLNGQLHPGSWKLGLQQGYQNFSGAVVDVGNRVNRQLYNTALSVTYEISPRTSVEVDGRQSINHYERLVSYNEWSGSGWVDYEVTPLLKAGLGVTGGFVDVQHGVNQTYEQILARLTYSLTELVDLRASAGGELREFEGGQKDRFSPVFTVGATIRPLPNTSIAVDAYRRSQASAVFTNQNYTTTGFSAGVRQVLFENYALNVTGGYENSDYSSNFTGVAANRKDDYFFTRIAVDWSVLDKLTVGAFYQFRNNDSTDPSHSFDNHQVGLNAVYHF